MTERTGTENLSRSFGLRSGTGTFPFRWKGTMAIASYIGQKCTISYRKEGIFPPFSGVKKSLKLLFFPPLRSIMYQNRNSSVHVETNVRSIFIL